MVGLPAFELVFQSDSHNASLVAKLKPEVGIAFWYYEHGTLNIGKFYYSAAKTGPNWVSMLPEDNLELLSGQDEQLEPRMFCVDEMVAESVFDLFMQTGERNEIVKWELEDEVIRRLGSQGCFGEI